MKQETSAKLTGKSEKIHLICDPATPLGELHDFLMEIKGNIVERMIQAQKEEEVEVKENDAFQEMKADDAAIEVKTE